jgi:phosphodiesterase/alkaline phosphatase D-like protein
MSSKSLVKHCKGFGSGFTKLYTKLDAHTLLDFAIHHGQNKTQKRKITHTKTMHVHSVVSHGRLMQQACGSVTLASLLILFHRGSYNNNSQGTF